MNTSLQVLISLISLSFIHWVADFIAQTHWQATNKSKNNFALTSHVFSYTWVFFISLILAGIILNFLYHSNFLYLHLIIIFVLINGILHWITDYFTSRLNAYLWNKKDVHNFFVSVGADQFIHFTTLSLTFYYIFL